MCTTMMANIFTEQDTLRAGLIVHNSKSTSQKAALVILKIFGQDLVKLGWIVTTFTHSGAV